MSNYMLLTALRKFALRRLNNIRRTLGVKTMARTAYRAGLPVELAIAALYCKGE